MQQLPVLLFFVYMIIRELLGDGFIEGGDNIVRLIPFLVVSLIFPFYHFHARQVKNATIIVIAVNYLLIIYGVLYGLYLKLFEFSNLKNSIYSDFSYYQWLVPMRIGFHPPFWSFFIVISALIVSLSTEVSRKRKYLFNTISFVFLILLSSRTSLLLFIVVQIISYIYRINREQVKWSNILTLLFIGVSSFLVIKSSPYLMKKLKSNDGMSNRIKLWDSGNKVISENVFFGTSFSSFQNEIEKKYKIKNKPLKNYDPHNMFYYIIGAIGFFGLILFLASIFAGFLATSRKVVLLFCVVLFFTGCTETVLNRQMGVFTFSIFFGLLSNSRFTSQLVERNRQLSNFNEKI